jgi:hypothetical protein
MSNFEMSSQALSPPRVLLVRLFFSMISSENVSMNEKEELQTVARAVAALILNIAHDLSTRSPRLP